MKKNLIVTAILISSLLTSNANASISKRDYENMSLEQLVEIPVFSASKREESAFKASSAIEILTSDDIRRSGATSVPEALRLVPGVQVARITSNKWAVTARGFNAQFSNKLLVLVDGMSVYNNLFSGVYWDTRGVPLEDVDRIEVVKGAGTTMWGSNAVNGVINIITKKSLYDQGNEVVSIVGNKEQKIYARHGGEIGKKNYDEMSIEEIVKEKQLKRSKKYYRVYAESTDNDNSVSSDGSSSNNDWLMHKAGFRFDINRREKNNDLKDEIIIKSDFHAGEEEQTFYLPSLSSPNYRLVDDADESVAGGNFLIKWDKEISSKGDGFFAQIYYDSIKRKSSILEQTRNIVDFEFQNNIHFNNRNLVSWGLNYRYIDDNNESKSRNGITYLDYNPLSEESDIISLFIQDKITLISEELFFTFGSKFSHNDYTHSEVQPNARLTYLPTKNQTLWAAVSKSVRTPTRGEDGITAIVTAVPTSNAYVAQVGNDSFASEESISTEIGYRNKVATDVTFDVSSFYTRYDKILSQQLVTGDAYINGEGLLVLPIHLRNDASANVYGGELSINYDVNKDWRMILGYNYLQVETDLDANYSDATIVSMEGDTPENQFTIRSQYNITANLELDNTLYFVDELESLGVDKYYRFDTRVTWYPKKDLELSIVGKNLLDDRHQEYEATPYSISAEVERSFYLKLGYKF